MCKKKVNWSDAWKEQVNQLRFMCLQLCIDQHEKLAVRSQMQIVWNMEGVRIAMNLNCWVPGLSTLVRLYSLSLGIVCSFKLIPGESEVQKVPAHCPHYQISSRFTPIYSHSPTCCFPQLPQTRALEWSWVSRAATQWAAMGAMHATHNSRHDIQLLCCRNERFSRKRTQVHGNRLADRYF